MECRECSYFISIENSFANDSLMPFHSLENSQLDLNSLNCSKKRNLVSNKKNIGDPKQEEEFCFMDEKIFQAAESRSKEISKSIVDVSCFDNVAPPNTQTNLESLDVRGEMKIETKKILKEEYFDSGILSSSIPNSRFDNSNPSSNFFKISALQKKDEIPEDSASLDLKMNYISNSPKKKFIGSLN